MDVLREVGDTAERSGEVEFGTRCQVMDDLHHGRAFIAASDLSRKHGDIARQIAQ